MGNDQMVIDLNAGLDIVADNARSPAAGRHGARIWIGKRDLPVGRCKHPGFKALKTHHLLLEPSNLLLQLFGLGRQCLRRFLPVGGVELM